MNIAVTGVHAGGQRSPGLSVAKALSSQGKHRLIAIDYDEYSTGFYQALFDEILVLPWSEDGKKMTGQIEAIQKEYPIDVIFPCLNMDVPLFSRIKKRLQGLGIQTLLPPATSISAREKRVIPDLIRNTSLSCPETAVCNTSLDIESAFEHIGSPCVIKGGECGVFPIHNRRMFQYYCGYCMSTFGFPILVQEWIQGEETSVFALCDKDSSISILAAVRKIGITDDGETWMSILIDDFEGEQPVKQIISKLQWVGPIEFDLIKNDDDLFILDINPRFPSWVDGLADQGVNAPSLALDIVSGVSSVIGKPISGSIFYKDFEDICFPVSELLTEDNQRER